jgi:hypothetical protein
MFTNQPDKIFGVLLGSTFVRLFFNAQGVAMATNDSMWGTHSAQRGWILYCLKSQTQPTVYSLPSPTTKARLNSTVVTWHSKTPTQSNSRPKELFYFIAAEGVCQVENHADHGGHKLVYQGSLGLKYKTVSPDKVALIFQKVAAGESFAQVAATI